MRAHLAVMAALAACSPPAFVPGASPLTEATPGPGIGASAEKSGVSVDARAEAWSGNPRDLAERATPLLLTVHNGGPVELWIGPEAFALVTGGATFHPLSPASFVGWSEDMTRASLKYAVIAPGSAGRGFVFFEHVAGRFGPIHVRAELVDARSGVAYTTLDLPFLLKSVPPCSDGRAYAARSRGSLFDTCPPL